MVFNLQPYTSAKEKIFVGKVDSGYWSQIKIIPSTCEIAIIMKACV